MIKHWTSYVNAQNFTFTTVVIADTRAGRAVFRDLPRRQAVALLRAGISSLSTLCLERCCRIELLLHARLSSQRLLGLLGL